MSLLPKKQCFKEYNIPSKNNINSELYRNTFLPTDNIAIKSINKNINTNEGNKLLNYEEKDNKMFNTYSNGFFNKKEKFGINNESYKRKYEEKPIVQTLNNRSGSSYNIINQDENYSSKVINVKMFDKKSYNMKKGVTEFHDLTRYCAPNYDRVYDKEYGNNPDIFKKNNGIFSHVYDRAHKNGFIIVPFKKEIKNLPLLNNRPTMLNSLKKKEFSNKKLMEKLEKM